MRHLRVLADLVGRVRDWVDCLLSIAQDNGHYARVRDALGAVGFFTVDQQAAPLATDRSPREIVYAEWSASNHKRFVFWRDPSGGGDLPGGHQVRYRYSPRGGSVVTATIPGSETTDRSAGTHGDQNMALRSSFAQAKRTKLRLLAPLDL